MIETNSGAIALLVPCICVNVNAATRTLVRTIQAKRWVLVHFQTNSDAVRFKYERNTDQRHLSEPKAGSNNNIQPKSQVIW